MSYIDLQVNGYRGVDFNQDDLSAESLHSACAALDADGVESILATIITDRLPLMCQRLNRLARILESHVSCARIIRGLHIEGPFLSRKTGFSGAHPIDAIRPPNVDDMKRLLEAAGGLTRVVTLAPECDEGLRVTRYLVRQGVVVSAGHCDPTLEQLTAAIDEGLTMFTHLGNGCPGTLKRHDNVIQRALALGDRLWLCMIADGVHIPFFVLSNYLKLAGDRAILTTDAMAAAGCSPGTHRLGRWSVEVGPDLAVWAPGRSHLLGSAVTMRRMEQNIRAHLGCTDDQVRMLTRTNPLAAVAGMGGVRPADTTKQPENLTTI
ncbi:MAG: N-acetylglucosamine-6-phosphate deacetylase [Phycisphaeraceae bacterium]|nr:N-acetylglucosamine-6-phosphate deacetylase [Phycisphaeraceae bacterium]